MERVKWDSHHGPAINVKDHGAFGFDLPDDEAQAIYERIAEMFWSDAFAIAEEHGYAGVYSEGRMGGWLVPHYSSGRSIRYWTDDLGSDEPEYLEEVAKFEKFGAAVVELLDGYRDELLDELADAVEERKQAAALLELGTPGGFYPTP